MQTIIIKLDPKKLQNPDLDLRYSIPDRIEEISHGKIQDNGYDYLDNDILAIWLSANSAEESYPMIVELFKQESFMENNLSQSVEIYISQKETDDIENCVLVFPE